MIINESNSIWMLHWTESSESLVGQERLERVMPAMTRLLTEWTDMFPYDFRDEGMTAAVRGVTQGCECVPSLCADVGALLQTLLARLTKLEQFEKQVAAWQSEGVTDRIEVLPAVGLNINYLYTKTFCEEYQNLSHNAVHAIHYNLPFVLQLLFLNWIEMYFLKWMLKYNNKYLLCREHLSYLLT